jgi:hypothetical protein
VSKSLQPLQARKEGSHSEKKIFHLESTLGAPFSIYLYPTHLKCRQLNGSACNSCNTLFRWSKASKFLNLPHVRLPQFIFQALDALEEIKGRTFV